MTGTLPLRVIHDGWCTFGLATMTLQDGVTIERVMEDHGEAVAVLPYDAARRTALLVRQVRVGVANRGGAGLLDEAPAGGIDDGEPDDTARREAMEEAGVRLSALERIGGTFTMPGVSTEFMHLYLAPYTAEDRIAAGGGLADEHEQIEVLEVALADLAAEADAGTMRDLKTLVLVQALRLRRPDLFA